MNKFCHQCGGRLTGQHSTPKFPSPESYTPKHLAEKILASKSALEGERKHVTVLFADIKGSTEPVIEGLDPGSRGFLAPRAGRTTCMVEAAKIATRAPSAG